MDQEQLDSKATELLSQESRYNSVRVVEYEGCIMYDLPNMAVIDPKSSDTYQVITQSEAGRLDKIAGSMYSNPKYWWIIGTANHITDPFSPLVNSTVRIPSISELIMEEVVG